MPPRPLARLLHRVHLISLDVARTFPHLGVFQEQGPFYDPLWDVLAAYTCYRPRTGYVGPRATRGVRRPCLPRLTHP